MGFALGPVFSSCSPTYALILAIILPAGFVFGFLALISYTFWLALILFAIAIFGQKLIKNLKWASNPNGWFKKILGVVFVLVGLAIITWFDKKIETKILDAGFLNTTNFEQGIVDRLDLENIWDDSETKKKTKQVEHNWEVCKDGTCSKVVEWSATFLNPKSILDVEENKITSEKWYDAPDLRWLTNWINSPEISSLSELRWQVVLIDFWTLGCINCINTHQETNKLYDEFHDQGFEILWLHAPEFAYERNISEVQKAVEKFEIKFPVAQDNEFSTWKAYNNRYWPAFYLIDKQWKVRYVHFWEWKYEEKREAIMELLSEIDEESIFSQEYLDAWLTTNTDKRSIDLFEVLDGWPWKDWIPAINNPEFISQEEALVTSTYLWEDDLGIVLSRWDDARFYGYDVLVWHEIVNDEIDEEKVSITFCPLCWSAIVYDRVVDWKELNFWVSWKLYNSNLLMYDDYNETLWSQSLWEAVVGEQLWKKLSVVKSDLMNYSEFQKKFPKGLVLSNDTGHNRRYGEIPYGNYDEDDALYFPINSEADNRYHSKELFYVANHNWVSVAFSWNDLREEKQWSIIVWDKEYIAKFSDGIAEIKLNNEIVPAYFEMWFSWINHNIGSDNIWSK